MTKFEIIHGYSHEDILKQFIRSIEFIEFMEQEGFPMIRIYEESEAYNPRVSHFTFDF